MKDATKELTVPDDDLNLPLAERQFPFRAAPASQVGEERARVEREEVRRATDVVLRGIDSMIYSIARRRFQNVTKDEVIIQETAQECRQHLWLKALPQYDAKRAKNTKVSTFIFQCIQFFMRQEVRAFIRRRAAKASRRVTSGDSSQESGAREVFADLQSRRDVRCDRRIEAIAHDVLSNPDKYFTAAQVHVFKAILDNPGVSHKELARRLGYKLASSLSTMLRRIKERVREIDIEEFEPTNSARPTDDE